MIDIDLQNPVRNVRTLIKHSRISLCAVLALTCMAHGFLFPCASFARQAGWVPAPAPADSTLAGKARKKAPRTKATEPGGVHAVAGETVYAGQPPVTDGELKRFVTILPQFRAWAKQRHEDAHPMLTADGRPDFVYSAKAAGWLAENGFNPARFFCIMGRMAAAMVIVEEGNDFKGTRPPDMPPVEPVELDLARRHLGELLKAGAPERPINK